VLVVRREAEEAAGFYVSLLPDSRVERVQKSPADGPAGKAGAVLVSSSRSPDGASWR
jgi:predicted 3-demethylubiquinone-9 3-methyltransferase (glyoxalase superfamily)